MFHIFHNIFFSSATASAANICPHPAILQGDLVENVVLREISGELHGVSRRFRNSVVFAEKFSSVHGEGSRNLLGEQRSICGKQKNLEEESRGRFHHGAF